MPSPERGLVHDDPLYVVLPEDRDQALLGVCFGKPFCAVAFDAEGLDDDVRIVVAKERGLVRVEPVHVLFGGLDEEPLCDAVEYLLCVRFALQKIVHGMDAAEHLLLPFMVHFAHTHSLPSSSSSSFFNYSFIY